MYKKGLPIGWWRCAHRVNARSATMLPMATPRMEPASDGAAPVAASTVGDATATAPVVKGCGGGGGMAEAEAAAVAATTLTLTSCW